MAAMERELIVANEGDIPTLRKLEGVLGHSTPKLVGLQGEEVELPESVFHVLMHIVHHLARGETVAVMLMSNELTTQEAADLLNISRPYLIKLLENGEIPFTKVGTHRRIRYSDLMRYKSHRDREREQKLAELTQMSQELGLYDL